MRGAVLTLFAFSLLPAVLQATPAACPAPLRTYPLLDREGRQLSCFDQWQRDFFNELQCPLKILDGNPGQTQREQMLRQGQIELLTGLFKAPTRPFQFSNAIARNHVYLYRLSSQTKWQHIKDWCDPVMQQARIIVPAEIYFGEAVERLRKEPGCAGWLINAPRGTGRHFSMLEKDRADLLISSELYWRQLPPAEARLFEPLTLTVIASDVHLAFSQQVPAAFIERVNALIALRQQRQQLMCQLPAANTPATPR